MGNFGGDGRVGSAGELMVCAVAYGMVADMMALCKQRSVTCERRCSAPLAGCLPCRYVLFWAASIRFGLQVDVSKGIPFGVPSECLYVRQLAPLA